MSDEIKEILDKAKEISNYGEDGKQHTRMFNQFEAKALLDYITNLQEENRKLKELNENASKVCMAEHRYGVDKAEEARDYKSRCEKAVEYIKEQSKFIEGCDVYKVLNKDILLNILTGGDKE